MRPVSIYIDAKGFPLARPAAFQRMIPFLNHPDLASLPKCVAPTLERISPGAAPKRAGSLPMGVARAAARAAALLLHCQERRGPFPGSAGALT
jgi:hypothetical protein